MKKYLVCMFLLFLLINSMKGRSIYKSKTTEATIQVNVDYSDIFYANSNLLNDLYQPNSLELKFLLSTMTGLREDEFRDYYRNYMDVGMAYSKTLDKRDSKSISSFNSTFKLFYGFNFLGKNFLSTDIYYYVHNGILWNHTTNIFPNNTSFDRNILSNFTDETNFGIMNSNGIRAYISNNVSCLFEMERNLIYPSHLFLQANLSSLSTILSDVIFSALVLSNFKNSSYLPILTLIFRGGLNYAFYELRSKKMNWPFSSEPAMLVTKYKFGLSYTF